MNSSYSLQVWPDAYGVSLNREGPLSSGEDLRVFYDEIPYLIESLKEVHNARHASRSEKL